MTQLQAHSQRELWCLIQCIKHELQSFLLRPKKIENYYCIVIQKKKIYMMWPYFYGTLQWESQYVEPLYSLVSINLWNNNLCNTDLSRLLCLFLYFLWSLSLQGERFSGGWRTGRKWSEVLRGGQFSGRSQEICVLFFFIVIPFSLKKRGRNSHPNFLSLAASALLGFWQVT